MRINQFKLWLHNNFGLTIEKLVEEAGITSGADGAPGADGADGVAADLRTLGAITVPGSTDLLLVQVGATYKKITFSDLVAAITAAQA